MGGEGQSKAAASADLRVGKCVVGWGDGKKGTPGHGRCDEHLDRNSSDEKVPSKVVSRGQGSRPGLGTWAGPAPTEAPPHPLRIPRAKACRAATERPGPCLPEAR